MKNPLISVVIIDYKKTNPYLAETFGGLNKQTYSNYEVILLTDYQTDFKFPKLRKKSYGRYASPAEKRDDGAKMAKGEIVAFLDDDATPDRDWLKAMAKAFQSRDIVAVGGPGVTPINVSWQEQASGWASASPLGAGPYTYRFLPRKQIFVDDYPSMNLAVRKKEFLSVGGYDSHYWPGEDTKLCLDLINKTGKKIIYDPAVLVYHHRRPLWKPHLKQNGNFGLHRGFFARILPQTSLRPAYFAPSLLFLGSLYLLLAFFLPNLKSIFLYPLSLIGFSLYIVLLLLNSAWIFITSQSLFQSLVALVSVSLTHYWYGLRFLQGLLFTKSLKR